MKAGLASVLMVLTLAGCVGTIEQKVQPIAIASGGPREICVVETAGVRPEFLHAYTDALTKRGMVVRVLPEGTGVGACPLITTYAARWQWDLALYLSYASLKVYRNNQLEGEALYDALQGGTKTAKFINAEMKIQELTDKLFPG